MVTDPVGGAGIAGTFEPPFGTHIAAVDEHGRTAVDREGHQHLERRFAFDRPQPGQHLGVGQVPPGGGDAAPLVIGCGRILLR